MSCQYHSRLADGSHSQSFMRSWSKWQLARLSENAVIGHISFDISDLAICAVCASSRLRRLTTVEVIRKNEITNEKSVLSQRLLAHCP